MSEPRDTSDRDRLASDPELGALLQRANVEYRADLDEAAAFRRTRERLDASQQPRSGRRALTALGLMCAAAASWLVWIQVGPERAPEVMFGPEVSVNESGRAPTGDAPAHPDALDREPETEPARGADDEAASARHDAVGPDQDLPRPAPHSIARAPRAALSGDALHAPEAEGDSRPTASDSELHPAPERTSPPSTTLPRAARPREHEVAPRRPRSADAAQGPQGSRGPGAGGASPARAATTSREDCLELARKGDPRAAERCFDARATGSGLGAEMALYEMARLRRDVLRDAAGALAALSSYRERFARGSLRNEVDLTRVELLAQLGRSAEALNESAALLSGDSGRERAAELHLLRGDVYRRDLGDLRSAAREYGQVEALGGARGAEASRRLGASLEALGDMSGALAAYRRYVRDPQRPHAAEVQRRIDRIVASARQPGRSP